jgi:hypothetical protein
MKKAKNLIIGCEHDGSYIPVNEVLKLIKLAQIEAIEETCRICANTAYAKFIQIPSAMSSRMYSTNIMVDKQSILSVADKLKKELG